VQEPPSLTTSPRACRHPREDHPSSPTASSNQTRMLIQGGVQQMPRVPLDEECVRRALEVQALLAKRSQHRAVPLPDLLIAACAERARLTVLHYDADFDRIAKLTGQSVQWVVPRGNVA